MPRDQAEARIRDYLAERLDLVEPGLTLIKKEEVLPNDRGAKGFVDIFARDAQGRLVIIEIKRSDAAARSAITELSKYAALIRGKFLVKHQEYRLIVLSTEWHELLTPYTEFARATNYAISAGKIILSGEGNPTIIEPVEPAELPSERRILPRHHWEFMDEATARAAVPKLANRIQGYGIADFVIVLLDLHDNPDGVTHFLYVGQLEKSFDDYMDIVRKRFSGEELEEFEHWLSDITELSDRLGEAGDKAMEASSADLSARCDFGSASYQIAHPEKARYWFDEKKTGGWEIFRFGRFVDPYLSDDQIIKELIGHGGESSYFVNMAASLGSRPETAALLGAVESAFFFNPAWRTAVQDLLKYAQSAKAKSLSLRAFVNDDIVRSLAGLATGLSGYMPRLEIEIEHPDRIENFVGRIEWNGATASADEIAREHFDGDLGNYLLFHHFGMDRTVNEDVMSALGLTYTLWRVDEGPLRVRVRGASFSESKIPGLRPITDLVRQDDGPVPAFANLLLECDFGFSNEAQTVRAQALEALMNDREAFEASEQELKATRDDAMVRKQLHWSGDLEQCDVCKRPFDDAELMVDASLRLGAWGCVCALCFKIFGQGIGIGYGQVYQKIDEGWLQIAGGFAENEGEDEL